MGVEGGVLGLCYSASLRLLLLLLPIKRANLFYQLFLLCVSFVLCSLHLFSALTPPLLPPSSTSLDECSFFSDLPNRERKSLFLTLNGVG